jgi:hopene-associated glycosyltransferase HpnB
MKEGVVLLSGLVLGIWVYLVLFHGRYWRERPAKAPADGPKHWPEVAAIVPARNEAPVVGEAVRSLLRQDYPGRLRIILVDDQSSDGTADIVRATADELGAADRVRVIAGKALPEGWTGKMWAVHQGSGALEDFSLGAKYVWLTDADIAHDPDSLRGLVARAEAGKLALTSLMARLRTDTIAERALVPAYVYFFQMLYPFAWVADRDRRTAAAAGGCTLVRRDALQRAGGIAAIRAEIIDDCALARRLKEQGPIWLGLGRRAASLRPYGGFSKIGRMISRSAYAQLGYSPLALVGTVAAMLLVYIAPPLLALLADGPARWLGLSAWLVMAITFQPMLRFYRRSPLWGLALPAIGAVYALFTVQSAIEFWRGRGGLWKGRVQAMAGDT